MITRRDALKIAASMSAVMPLLPMSVRDALAALDRPIGEAVAAKTDKNNMLDPVAFAEGVTGLDWGYSDVNFTPEEYAEVGRVMHALEQAVPTLAARETPTARLWDQLSDAIYALAGENAWAGIRVGAAAENFRMALVGSTQTCPDCLNMYGRETRDRATCRTCNGAGVTRTPGVTAR